MIGLIIFACILIAAAAFFGVMQLRGREEGNFAENSYDVKGNIDNIYVDVVTADVSVQPSTDGKCRVVCLENEKIKFDVWSESGTLNIRQHKEIKLFGLFGYMNKKPTVTIYLAQDSCKQFRSDSVSGDLLLPEGFSFEDVTVSCTSGDITLLCDIVGDVSVKTVSGDLKLNGQNAKNLKVGTTSGDVTLENVKLSGDGSISTTSGQVHITSVAVKDMLKVKTTSGDTKLDNVVAGSFKIEGVSSDIELMMCDADKIDITTVSGDVKGKLLTDKTFYTTVVSGKVRLPANEGGGSCYIKTTSGDITFS